MDAVSGNYEPWNPRDHAQPDLVDQRREAAARVSRRNPVGDKCFSERVASCQLHDSQGLGEVLAVALPSPGAVGVGDGAYDRRMCYAATRRHQAHWLSPPGQRAGLHAGDDWHERNRSVAAARFLGRKGWKLAVDDPRRSLAESALHRLKSAFGQRPPSDA